MTDTDPYAVSGPASARPGWRARLLLAPMIAWLAAFVVLPALILVAVSFCERDELGRVVASFTPGNYTRVLDPVYLGILVRSLGYATATTTICLLAGYPVAWFIARSAEPWRSRLLLLVMIPFWTSFLIRTYAWITILKTEGLLNGLLLASGAISSPLEILYSPFAVLVGLVYSYLPFMILPVYASAEKVDGTLIEAAQDLGCGPAQVFAKVIVPLTTPGILAGVLLVFVPAIGMFAITDLMGGARVPLIGSVIQNQFLQARDWPFGAALGVVFMGLFILVYGCVQRLGAIEEETRG